MLALAKNYAEDPNDNSFSKLAVEIRALCPKESNAEPEKYRDLLNVARVFHEFLILSEVAERQHRVRRWRAYRRGESGLFFKQTCKDAFNLLIQKGFKPSEIRDTLLQQNVELVLTAHPTQASRRTLLDKYFK